MRQARILRKYAHKKAPDVAIRGFSERGLFLDLNLVGLHAFLTLHSDEADFLAFFQALEAITFDRAEVHEQIRTAFGSDKTKTFLVVKPLDGTVLTIRHVFFLETIVDDSLQI